MDKIENAGDVLDRYSNAARVEDVADDLARALGDMLEILTQIEENRSNHPACGKHPEDDVISCGWKRVVRDVDAVMDRARGRA